jgi:Arm DNA-binding domain/Phage integrase, N-terminal SAM-like domain
MPKLTKSIVDAATPRTKQFTIWCSELKGFGVFVQPSGSRTYFVDYRNRDGIRKRTTIGRHGKITVDRARKLAIATLGETVKGGDPAEERAQQRKALTVQELCDRYLAAAEKGLIFGQGNRPKKASSLYVDRGRINRHILPLLGKMRVQTLKPADINKFVEDVASGKTATIQKTSKKRGKSIVRGGLGTAARVGQYPSTRRMAIGSCCSRPNARFVPLLVSRRRQGLIVGTVCMDTDLTKLALPINLSARDACSRFAA